MARSTRLVAIGWLRMNSALPASIQQKYSDHGRSVELLTMTRPMSRARSSCGSGGEAEERVDLTFGEQIHRPDGLTRDPADIPAGIEPDVGQHAAHEHVRAGTQGRHPDGLAFQ